MDEPQVEDIEELEDEMPRWKEECEEVEMTPQEADIGSKVRKRTSIN